MKRFAVYTAIVGDYDEIKQPMVVDGSFDYLLFSDTIKDNQVGIWKIKPIEYHNNVKTKVARWVKTHPEHLLPEYECSVWIDASVVIRDDSFYDRVKELFEQNVKISTLIHPDWTCTYQEMLHIMYLGWESEKTTLDWGYFLRTEKFPRNMGTFETRVLYRKHTEKNIKAFDELWWNCIERFSRRDQYSFRYCLWKESVKCVGFLPDDYDAHKNEYFFVEKHSEKVGKIVDGTNKSWLMRYYMKHADERKEIENVYYWIYGRKHYEFWWRFIGQFYRVKHLLLRFLGHKEVYLWELKNDNGNTE